MAAENLSPAVSIIIPMYNVEKYIGECLDSILAQTFENFELIIVDDYSTDKSFDIVGSYFPKFAQKNIAQGGIRLTLVKFKKNSGVPSIPRNRGMEFARGEYLFFMDSDDVLASNALEMLYSAAKETAADVLYCQEHYKFVVETLKDATEIKKAGLTDKRLEVIENPVDAFLDRKLTGPAWQCFFRREFIMNRKIKFPVVPRPYIYEDLLFNFFATFFAEKVAVTPGTHYYYRQTTDSVSKGAADSSKQFKIILNSALYISQILEKFMESQPEFFKDKPELRYKVFDRFVSKFALNEFVRKAAVKVPIHERITELYESLEKIGDKKYLTAFLFDQVINTSTECREQLKQLQSLRREIKKLS